MSRWLLAIVLLATASCHRRTGYVRSPHAFRLTGEAMKPPLTMKLPAGFTATRYRAELAVDPAKPTFHGIIEIDGTLDNPTTDIVLNAEGLTIASATVGGVAVEVHPGEHDFVRLVAANALPAGAITLRLEYDGTFSTTDSYGAFVETLGGDPYAYTQMEPLGARRVFPCIDEPGSKVPWQLTLVVPKDDVALGNAPAVRETIDGDRKRVEFAESKPLPAYLVAFAVGPFELVDAGTSRGGAPIRIAAFRGHAAETAWAVKVTGKLVGILEDWFGTPYPYAKLDLVPIPATVGFSAMENAGLITFRGSRMLLDPRHASDDDRRSFTQTAAHEIAHQWFGDSVTPAWWDDLWLNESFATWMEGKALATFSPAWARRVPVIVTRSSALDDDGLVSARRVRQPIERADDIETAFDSITYDKGSAVIRMFEHWVGADAFQAGVRRYLADHADGTATTDDFLTAIDQETPLAVEPAFRSFLDQAGAPRVGATLRCDGKKDPVLTLTQERWLPRGSTAPGGAAPSWIIPVCVAYGAGKTRNESCTTLTAGSAELALEGDCPKWFFPNAGGLGYYRMGLTAEALEDLIDVGWKQLGPAERVLVAGDVHAAVARGELPIGAELDLVPLLLRDGDHNAIEVAVRFAEEAFDVASDASRDAVRAWIRKTYGKRAKKLGFLPDKGDDADRERKREALVGLVAEIGHGDKLLERAVELAASWTELPGGSRGLVLAAAAVESADVRATLRAAVPKLTTDAVARDLWIALGASDDPDDAGKALELLLDASVDLEAGTELLDALAAHRRTQPIAAAFLRAHWDELLPRLPAEGAAGLITVLTASCSAADRADAERWAKDHIEGLSGGQRTTAQALESMDQCIARRAAMSPELDAWLEAR